jgi:oligopeptide transport system substrate-binding protein
MLFPVREDVIEKWKAQGEPEMWTRPENIVSNGPYVLTDHRFRYELTLERNPHHVLHDKLRVHKVAVLEVEAYHPTMNLYRSGDLDYLGDNSSLPTEYVRFLESKKDFLRYPYNATYWYELNTKKPPLDNVLVRRALNLAMDKNALVQHVTRGGQKAASHYVPDIMGLGYDQAVKADQAAGTDPFADPEHTFNPPLARKLLKDAGYEVREENGRFSAQSVPPVEILYNTSEAHRNLAVAIQGMWKEHLGITVTLRNEEWKVMLKNVRDGNFQVVRFGWVAEYNHAQTYMDTFLSFSPSNRTKWGTQEFDDAVRLAASTADPVESIRLYRKAELLAVDAVPKIPLYFYTKQTLIKPWVRGFRANPKNLQLFKWLWIEQGRTTMPEGLEAPAVPDQELPPPGRIAPAAVKAGPP